MDLIDLHSDEDDLMDDFIRSRVRKNDSLEDKEFLDFDHDKLDLIEDESIPTKER